MDCKIAKLTRYPSKGGPGIPVTEMKLVAGHGALGDPYRGGDRQVSLLSASARCWVDAQSVSGLCFGRFRENILIDNLPDNLMCGTMLSAGDVALRITAGKECFDECRLRSSGEPCSLSRSAVFAAVEQDGTIRVGDSVSVASMPEK